MTPPGTLRVVLLLARVAMRRRLNRITATIGKRLRARGQKRTGTARKHPGRLMLVLFSGIFLFNGVNIGTRFIERLSATVELTAPSGRITVSPRTYEAIRGVSALCRRGEARCKQAAEGLGRLLRFDRIVRWLPDELRQQVIHRLREAAVSRGLAAFRRAPSEHEVALLPGAALWPAPEHEPRMVMPIAAVLLVLSGGLFFLVLANKDQELGQVAWSMEWLYTFPVPARSLLLGRVLELSLTNFLNWFITMPLAFAVLVCAGWGWHAALAAPLAALHMGLLVAAAVVPAEALLRMRASPARLNNLQALFSVLGTVLLIGAMVPMVAPAGASWLMDASRVMPGAAAWLPPSLPALLLADAAPAAVAAMLLVAVALPPLGAGLAGWAVRDGLLSAAGAHQGRRGAGRPAGRRLIGGIIGRELRHLARNRAFLVQTLVVPILVFGIQVAMNPALLRGAASDMQHAATLAFGLGAYVLLSSALHVLSFEGEALWILTTLPRDLSTILADKARLWCGIALLWTVGTLVACALASPSLDLGGAALHGATAIAGVVIYSYIAAGIGVLATDPLETEARRRLRPEATFLLLMLGSMFALAIYTDGPWPKLAQIVLSALLALALWQKVRDRAPFLLDPTAAPPPAIAVADGLIAALAFFVVQGLAQLIALRSTGRAPDGELLLIAFVVAGGLVSSLALYTFRRAGVPHLLATVGFRGGSVGRALGLGLAGGAAAALFGLGYLWLLDHVAALHAWKEASTHFVPRSSLTGVGWIVALAVAAAPLFEEFIFRGLVYRGLRRSYPVWAAVTGSAAIFAIVHPAISALPVFVLALVAALVFEHSGLLLGPILVHAVYNAVVVLSALHGGG